MSYVENAIRRISRGAEFMSKCYMFGQCIFFLDFPTEKARKKLVKSMCGEIKRLAKEYPENFFIQKDCRGFIMDPVVYSVGTKLSVPHMSSDLK